MKLTSIFLVGLEKPIKKYIFYILIISLFNSYPGYRPGSCINPINKFHNKIDNILHRLKIILVKFVRIIVL